MWTSIQQIIKPVDLQEALALQSKPEAVLFAGGSYLVAEKDSRIHTLIDVGHLLDNRVAAGGDGLTLGAGISLQDLLQQGPEGMRQVIKAACPSKNIRNQRTLGGEIARGRTDSDLLVYLYAAGTLVHLHDSKTPFPIQDWDGSGIITRITVPDNPVSIERVALLDSAPAFVLAAVGRDGDSVTLAVGGKASRILSSRIPYPLQEEAVRSWLQTVESIYSDDHLGTITYKRQLVANLVSAMAVTL